jgi:hypothetical protein
MDPTWPLALISFVAVLYIVAIWVIITRWLYRHATNATAQPLTLEVVVINPKSKGD